MEAIKKQKDKIVVGELKIAISTLPGRVRRGPLY
jgi:hypothetical protein